MNRMTYAASESVDRAGYLTYWGKRDRWVELGRKVGELRLEAKQRGVPLEEMPGARTLIEAFKAAGREVDRRVR
jgi:hypothetical protein